MDNAEMKKDFDFFEQLRKNWGVILVVCGIISSWAYFQFQLSNLTTRVAAVELKAAAIDGSLTEIKASISGIDAKVTILLDKYLKND